MRDIVLARMHTRMEERPPEIHTVESWGPYGIVVPRILTTNGSILVATWAVWSRIDPLAPPSPVRYVWESCHEMVPVAPTHPTQLWEGFLAAHISLLKSHERPTYYTSTYFTDQRAKAEGYFQKQFKVAPLDLMSESFKRLLGS